MIPGFSHHDAHVNGQNIACSTGGDGPPVLLLHGFPQTRMMWHAIAPALAGRFCVVAADLRGYGDSAKPAGVENYSFRAMATDQVALMAHLGHDRFHVVGHDRGGRTAHRMALDHPDRVLSLTVMDIVPTHHLLHNLTPEVARAYYHWFFLAQPEPFPDTMIAADSDRFYESCLVGWGGASLDAFDPAALDAYRASWRRPDTIRAMCDDYRAALAIDDGLDAADLDRQVTCPALVLFGADGAMAEHYDVPATWSPRLADMRARAIPGGHFFPDTHPQDTIDALQEFLANV